MRRPCGARDVGGSLMATMIVDPREKQAAARAWLRCFTTNDPFGWPFRPALSRGRVLYPTDGCQLHADQFARVAQLAGACGDTFAYLAVLEGMAIEGDEIRGEFHRVSLDDFHGYASLCLTLDSALYSPSGRWAMAMTHEHHGVLGVAEPCAADPFLSGDGAWTEWAEFALYWRDVPNIYWIETLRRHVFPS